MSEENVEIVRQLYEAWNRDDIEWELAHTDPDWEFQLHRAIPGMDRVYRGPDGLRKFRKGWRDLWETLTVEVDQIIDVDEDRVLGLVHLRGTGRDGIDLAIEYAHLITIRDGRPWRVQGFLDWSDALAAAGLSE